MEDTFEDYRRFADVVVEEEAMPAYARAKQRLREYADLEKQLVSSGGECELCWGVYFIVAQCCTGLWNQVLKCEHDEREGGNQLLCMYGYIRTCMQYSVCLCIVLHVHVFSMHPWCVYMYMHILP